jgi:hypothetical protein
MRQKLTLAIVTRYGLALLMSMVLASAGSAQEMFGPAAEMDAEEPVEVTPADHVPDYASRPTMNAHFPRPTRSFGMFRSLTTYGAASRERCMPEMFSPRGVGIARRTSRERMDYSPYVVTHSASNHGPSYYQRLHLFPCRHPHHCERKGLHFGWQVYY